jgi:hypothetical protein
LHNFCVNERLKSKQFVVQVPLSLPSDNVEILTHGGISIVATEENNWSPEEILHGGEHDDDTTDQYRRQVS